MSQVMDKLHADHVNTTKLLDVMTRQLDVLHEGGSPDFVLLIDLMHYMTNYSGLLHHPKEDLVFTRMVERDPATRQVVDGLLEEHRTLARIGEQFLGNLRGAVSELLVDRQALENQGREYVRILRGHLDREESSAFPRARAAHRRRLGRDREHPPVQGRPGLRSRGGGRVPVPVRLPHPGAPLLSPFRPRAVLRGRTPGRAGDGAAPRRPWHARGGHRTSLP